ncbi:hypothetical protein Zmor_013839 [Zophobas morio]|uniref:Uncharacterized protein n=1 Tax=Zophobas morio TaxID=2755281 RepID=A0AA38MF23_9CUCU|nr:hypothetical protein Zmor_013839 [Zophobas morio]
MYVTYILISVVLVLIGIVGSVYFVRFLKNTNFKNVTIPALSESINTFLIGIFYLYCAIVMAQNVITSKPTPMNNENDITIIEEGVDPTTEHYENPNTEIIEDTTSVTTVPLLGNSSYPNQDFLLSYQTFMQNALRQSAINKKHKDLLEKSETREIENQPETNATNFNEGDCFDEIFMENSMFLYSFLHSAVSLLVSTTKTPSTSSVEAKIQKSKKKEDSTSEEIPTQNNGKPETCDKENHTTEKLKLIVIIFVIFLIPVVCIIALYFVLERNMQDNSVRKLLDPNRVDSNKWDIIYKPLNVSTPENKPEINNIINNIYTIINSTRDTTPPTFYDVSTRRRPKQLGSCPKFNMLYRFYALLVFLFYFVTTLYTKVKEMELRTNDAKAARQLHISIIIFAVLWLFSILDMFSKTYLLDSSRSNILTEIFLSLGNLNHLSIIASNYLTAKETIKKYNLVEPQA